MKLMTKDEEQHEKCVTLYVRVWIETVRLKELTRISGVTLYVRVWIETDPMRIAKNAVPVTLYVRVWIET